MSSDIPKIPISLLRAVLVAHSDILLDKMASSFSVTSTSEALTVKVLIIHLERTLLDAILLVSAKSQSHNTSLLQFWPSVWPNCPSAVRYWVWGQNTSAEMWRLILPDDLHNLSSLTYLNCKLFKARHCSYIKWTVPSTAISFRPLSALYEIIQKYRLGRDWTSLVCITSPNDVWKSQSDVLATRIYFFHLYKMLNSWQQ